MNIFKDYWLNQSSFEVKVKEKLVWKELLYWSYLENKIYEYLKSNGIKAILN